MVGTTLFQVTQVVQRVNCRHYALLFEDLVGTLHQVLLLIAVRKVRYSPSFTPPPCVGVCVWVWVWVWVVDVPPPPSPFLSFLPSLE